MNRLYAFFVCWIFLGILFSSITGCKTIEKVSKNPLKKRGPQHLLAQLKENELQYQWLSAKVSCEATLNNKEVETNIRLRHKKDSVIWLSISPALGIEMARVLITKDSLFYLNRLEKSYYKGTIEYLNRSSPVELNYSIIQSFLTGNAYFHNAKPGSEKGTKFKSSIQQNKYVLSTLNKRKHRKSLGGKTIKDTTMNRIWLNPVSYKIEKLELINFSSNNQLVVSFNEFTKKELHFFPSNIFIDIKAEAPITINLDFSRVIFDETLSMPFSIPKKYERVK
jgi:hypothetical protein